MRAILLFTVLSLGLSAYAQVPCDVTLTAQPISCTGAADGGLTVVTNSGGPFTYAWDFDPGQTGAVVTGLAAGFYSVIVEDAAAGCITVFDTVLVEPSVTITGTVDYCPSDPPVLTAQPLGGLDPVDYQWTTGDTVATIYIPAGTTGLVDVTVTGSNGCVVTAQVNLTELPSPMVALGAPDTTCQMVLTLVETIATTADSLVWRWGVGNYGFSNDYDPLIAFSGSGWQPVSLQGFDSLGCGGLPVLDSIYAQWQVPAIFTALQVPCTPTVDIVLGSNADSCAFFIGDSLVTHDCAAYFRWNNMRYDSVAFTLYATQANGCNDTLEIIVDIRTEPTLFYANAFTPNEDGINDLWPDRIEHSDHGFELALYDRWGERIWETTDPNEQWDGKLDGDPAPLGVYVYTVKRRDPCEPTRELSDTGHLTIFR